MIMVFVYILFGKKPTKDRNPYEPGSSTKMIWKQIQSRPFSLETSSGYPEDLRDYLETLRGKETFLYSGNRDLIYEEIRNTYPDERGEVLFAIYNAFIFFVKEREVIESDTDLTELEKLTEIKRIMDDTFPPWVREKIFQNHPLTPSRLLLASLRDYIAKNPLTFSRERNRMFIKLRKEIYAEKEREIRHWEDEEFWREIVSLIYSREMAEMQDWEKQEYSFKKLEEFKLDFWN